MKRFLVFCLLCLLSGGVLAQSRADERRAKREAEKARTTAQVDSLIGNGAFTFIAERAITSLPAKPYVTLDGRDFLRITPQKIESYLPFYGRLYSAPIGASDGPLTFESEQFSYKTTSGKNGDKHLVHIEVERNTSSLPLTRFSICVEAFDDATATATVTFTTGSVSTYFGRIEPNKP